MLTTRPVQPVSGFGEVKGRSEESRLMLTATGYPENTEDANTLHTFKEDLGDLAVVM